MPTKTPWEERVQMLLHYPQIPWYFKAPDGVGYGGRPRIDFVACDMFGRFIIIEVKSLPMNRKTFDPKSLVPAVQQDILNRVTESANGCAILAVGSGRHLSLYNWEQICRLDHVELRKTHPFLCLEWNGPKEWKNHNLHEILRDHWTYGDKQFSRVGLPQPVTMHPPFQSAIQLPESKMMRELRAIAKHLESGAITIPRAIFEQPSPSTGASLSISKPPASTSMRRKKLLSGLRSSRPEGRRSS